MKAIFLAAGEGKRFKPLRGDKLLLPIMGKSLFSHILSRFKEAARFDELIIIANQANRQGLEKAVKDLELKAEFVLSEPLGMGYALLKAKERLSGEILILNADDFLEGEVYSQVLKKAHSSGAEIVLAGKKAKKYFPGGYFKLEGEKIRGIVEKPGEGNEPSDLVKLVVDYFKRGEELVKALEEAKTDHDNLYEIALDNLINSGVETKVYEFDGFWQGVKYPWHILEIASYLLRALGEEVILEEGVKVFEGAKIKGPAYIGKNTIVGDSALIRESIIESDSLIGGYTEVARSYIGPKSWFHKNYIGDSVIEGDFKMGSGAVTANLRLDDKEVKAGEDRVTTGREKLGLIAGEGVRIGCNSTTLPGVMIGANSLIGAGIVIHKDIRKNTKMTLKQEYQVEEESK